MKIIGIFYLKIFSFGYKFSVYLNRLFRRNAFILALITETVDSCPLYSGKCTGIL